MKDPHDLRKILSQNIRNARKSLHISQEKLAECAGISVSHVLDIEYCKTWVSDKTLNSIAQALNMEVFELLTPEKESTKRESRQKKTSLKETIDLVSTKKSQLGKKVGEAMDDLIMEIIKQHGDKS